ncbi:hypothetical protein [Mycoplasma yeatsii]|uniref:Uncharacterized protein n=1 Tax=Mycoplasma yeatsii TaxID=51365 RepID=A0ABU0NEN4_9MOLU|nr:hypothetical protein [Mycoplasma yeatsii]MDQ0567891.1 hypothetical protein [Mycoplasma yeatsii]
MAITLEQFILEKLKVDILKQINYVRSNTLNETRHLDFQPYFKELKTAIKESKTLTSLDYFLYHTTPFKQIDGTFRVYMFIIKLMRSLLNDSNLKDTPINKLKDYDFWLFQTGLSYHIKLLLEEKHNLEEDEKYLLSKSYLTAIEVDSWVYRLRIFTELHNIYSNKWSNGLKDENEKDFLLESMLYWTRLSKIVVNKIKKLG